MQREVSFRKLKAICAEDLARDVAASTVLSDIVIPLDEMSMLLCEKDHCHATLHPWPVEDVHDAKHVKRKTETTWCRTTLNVHHELYHQSCECFTAKDQMVILLGENSCM